MGEDSTRTSALLDDALDLAERLAAAAEEEGRVDLGDLGRRRAGALVSRRRAAPPEAAQLF